MGRLSNSSQFITINIVVVIIIIIISTVVVVRIFTETTPLASLQVPARLCGRC